MTNTNWTNSEGEPLMDAAALRFEADLDRESAEQRYLDDYEDGGEPDGCDDPNHECEDCNGPSWTVSGWHCTYCDRPCAKDAHEDQDGADVERWETTEPRDVYWSGTGEDVGDDSYIDYLNR